MTVESTPPFFSEPVQWLGSLESFGVRPGLERIRSLLFAMGNPQEGLRLIHVAGTNGKGSVCAMVAACLAEAGLAVGMYTSPHLVTPRERIRVGGRAVASAEFADLAALAWKNSFGLSPEAHPTYFEVFTAMAAECFRRRRCDAVLWETGMGGRLDATNAAFPALCVITGVDFDHAEHLGGTLAEIAGEKAGILKSRVPAVVGFLPPEAQAVVESKASALEAPLTRAEAFPQFDAMLDSRGWRLRIDGVPAFLPLRGRHQLQNLKTALSALRLLSHSMDFDFARCLQGLEKTRWPARMQALPDGSLLDGAHNPQGVRCLAAFLEEIAPESRFDFVFGCIEGKNPMESLAVLAPLADSIHLVPVRWSKSGVDPETLRREAAKALPGVRIKAHGSLSEAFSATNPVQRVVAGSLYLAGEALTLYFSKDAVADFACDEPFWPHF